MHIGINHNLTFQLQHANGLAGSRMRQKIWPMLDLWLRAPQPEPESSVRLFARLIPGRFKYHFGLVKRVGKLRPMRRAISSLLECPWVIIKSCFPAERNFPPVFWMSEVAHASDQSRMSWTDENHHLILTTLSAKAALVFSQLIRRGAKCRKERDTALWEVANSSDRVMRLTVEVKSPLFIEAVIWRVRLEHY